MSIRAKTVSAKTQFITEIKNTPLEQDVPIYECEDCDFKDILPSIAIEHKFITEHNLKKSITKRIVAVKREKIGDKTNIIKIEDDILILCDDCK